MVSALFAIFVGIPSFLAGGMLGMSLAEKIKNLFGFIFGRSSEEEHQEEIY